MVKATEKESNTFSLKAYNAQTLITWNTKGKSKIDRTKHAVLGIIDEAGEISKIFKKMVGYDKAFDKTGLIEELGDFLYYLVRIADETGYSDQVNFYNTFDDLINDKKVKFEEHLSATDYCIELSKHVYLIASSAGKYELPNRILDVIPILKRFALYSGVNMVEVAKANIRKLENRHGATYNPENLEQRDTEKEREVIEKQE